MIHDRYKEAIRPLFKDDKEFEEFLVELKKPLKKSFTVPGFRVDRERFVQLAEGLGWELSPSPFPELEGVWYVDRENKETPLGSHFLHACGYLYIQEVAASTSAQMVDLPENGIVLDMSAAPGGKTAQLCDRLIRKNPQKAGLVRANDLDNKRMKALNYNINRMGTRNVVSTVMNGAHFGKNFPEFFDAVLLDAPCSGEGTGFKSDFALKYRKENQVKQIAHTQFQLLVSACKTTKIGGCIVYSTCTINPTENESVIKKLLEQFPGAFEVEEVKLTGKGTGVLSYRDTHLLTPEQSAKLARLRPHIHHTGGFFLCKLRKVGSIGEEMSYDTTPPLRVGPRTSTRFSYDSSSKGQKRILQAFEDQFGVLLDSDTYLCITTAKQIYLVSKTFRQVEGRVGFDKVGIPIAKMADGLIKPLHCFGAIFGHLASKNVVALSAEQAQAYSQWKDLLLAELALPVGRKQGQYVILTRNWLGISVGKIVGDVVKNKFW